MSQQHILTTSGRKGWYLSAAFLLALTVIGTGCKKQTSSVGLGALDPDVLLNSGGIDTFQLKTYSVAEDTMLTDNQTFAVLGYYHDPKMGTFDASFYTQFKLANSVNFNQGSSPVLDSAVLSLRYRGYYGKLTQQTFEVYRLDDTLGIETDYRKSDTKNVQPGNLVYGSSGTQTPAPSDSVTVGDGKKPAQLRLRLNDAFGQTILDDAAIANNPYFSNDDLFRNEYFKGLLVKSVSTSAGPGNGGVFYFDLKDANSKITLYYHIDGDPKQYELVLEANGNCADFNHVVVNNSGYPVESVIAQPLNGQTQYYAQAFRSRGKVDFPTLNNLPKNAIVHNALLVVPVAHQTLNSFYPSVQMSVGYLTDEGKIVAFDVVVYDDDSKSYIVDVRDYVQDILSGDAENRGVYLYPTFFSSTAERIIFNGPNTSNKEKPKLIVKYTEF